MSRAESRWGHLGKTAWHPTAGRVVVTQVEEDINQFIRISYPNPASSSGTATRRVPTSSLVFDDEEGDE